MRSSEQRITLFFEVGEAFIKIIHIRAHAEVTLPEVVGREMRAHEIYAPLFIVFKDRIIQIFYLRPVPDFETEFFGKAVDFLFQVFCIKDRIIIRDSHESISFSL